MLLWIMQYLQERVDADCACSVLLIASQYNLGELAKRASGCILSQIAAMTCSAGLVDDVYRLPLYAFDCLLHSAGEVMSVRALPQCACPLVPNSSHLCG